MHQILKNDTILSEKILVTGASGFLGQRLVKVLVECGFSVRALVRKTSNIEGLQLTGVEIAYGDITDLASVDAALVGIDCVIHAAAGTSGSEEVMHQVTTEGTKNILDVCQARRVRKLVYVSSCSVYGIANCERGAILNEMAPLENEPLQRGAYSGTKLDAEKSVIEAIDQKTLDIVCLRPGTIYGPGGECFTPMVGFSLKNKVFLVIDRNGFIMPLVYIDNLIDAIVLAMTSSKSTGKVYNVVDPEPILKKQYINTLVKTVFPGAFYVYLPYWLLFVVVATQEKLFSLMGRKAILTRYRLVSSQNPIRYDSSLITKDLGWRQRVSFAEAVKKIASKKHN